MIFCPVHRMRDCSPLLNGCSRVNKAHDVLDALAARLEAETRRADEAEQSREEADRRWSRSEARLEAETRARENAERELIGTTKLARQLWGMIPKDVWRASGGDDMQGHYEGDYHAEMIRDRLDAALAAARTGEAAPAASAADAEKDT
jgi:hypothetical protein